MGHGDGQRGQRGWRVPLLLQQSTFEAPLKFRLQFSTYLKLLEKYENETGDGVM